VVEVQNERISLTAVNARVLRDVHPQPPLPCIPPMALRFDVPHHVLLSMKPVVFAPVSTEALVADLVLGSSPLRSEMELLNWFSLTAAEAKAVAIRN